MGTYTSALKVFGQFFYATTFGAYLFVPRPKFTVKDVPNLNGKVTIVTGGNAGIGKATCKALLEKNAKVYLASRSEARAKAAIAELLGETGKEAIWLELDLSSFRSIEKAAEEFHSKESELHILFNNAGVMSPPIDALTEEGYDLTFGTNVLGHFYLTELLVPALYKASTPERKSRVVNFSSQIGILGASPFGSGLIFSTFKDSPARRRLSGSALYGQSKLGATVYAQEFARRYGDKIISVSVHPGPIISELPRNALDMNSSSSQLLMNMVLYPTPMGIITPLYGGTSPEVENLNGEYLTQWARVGTPRSNDPVLGRELWTWLEEQVQGREFLATIRSKIASLK